MLRRPIAAGSTAAPARPIADARRLCLEIAAAALAAALLPMPACASSRPGRALAVAPASPPDDATTAEGGVGGLEHAAALEQLELSPLGWRVDPQHSVRLLLPDAAHWRGVRFSGLPSLVGFRYGKGHHAVVAGIVTHVADETAPGGCDDAFEGSARPWLDAFGVSLDRDPPRAIVWRGKIAAVGSLVARAGLLGASEQYAIGYATFPAWKGACLVLGIVVPSRDELARSKAVRDRFVAEVLPRVEITRRTEPMGRF